MWESSARPFTHRLVQETIIQWLIDPAFRLLGERIMSKNVVAVTFAERVQISLEFSPCLSYFFFFFINMQENQEESLKQNETPQVQSP